MNLTKIIKETLVITFLLSFLVMGCSQETNKPSKTESPNAKEVKKPQGEALPQEANNPQETVSPNENDEKEIKKLQGEVLSVDAKSNIITVRGKKGKIHTIKIDSDTIIKQGKNKAEISDVKEGSRVKVKFFINDKSEKFAKFLKIVEQENLEEKNPKN